MTSAIVLPPLAAALALLVAGCIRNADRQAQTASLQGRCAQIAGALTTAAKNSDVVTI